MWRLLVAALLGAPAVVAAPVPPETDAMRMGRIYGIAFDPEGDSKLEPVGESLRITVPDSPRLLAPWSRVFNAPRVWQEVTGDFTVTVRVSFSIRPRLPDKHNGQTESRAGGGLVVWADVENFLTVTREEREADGEPGEFFRSEARVTGATRGYSEYTTPGDRAYLRVERTGKTWTESFSTDGKKWKPLSTWELPWDDAVKVGVVAENSFKALFTAVFDRYTVTVAKK